MDNAWQNLKRIILILLLFYLLAFLFETDFLLGLAQIEPKTNFGRFLFEILNIKY